MLSNTSNAFDVHVHQYAFNDPFYSSSFSSLIHQLSTPSIAKLIRSDAFEIGSRKVLTAFLFLAFPFTFQYLATWLFFQIAHWRSKVAKVPPNVPYTIPFLGSALGFGLNPGRFVTSSASVSLCYTGAIMLTRNCRELRSRNPFGVALPGGSSLYFLQGAENIITLWKKSTSVPGTKIHLFFLKHLFGMPEKGIKVYASDNSGIKAQPLSGSNVTPHHRIHYLTHTSMLRFMGGTGLAKWYERWATIFLENLQSLDLGEDWVEMPDLMDFVSEQFGSAILESMCGPILRKINPNLMQDLKKYHYGQPKRSKCFPEWMMPQAYAIRRKILSNIKEWHATARTQAEKTNGIHDDDSDCWWGSDFMKDRQRVFEGIDEFDYDAYASSDLGLIWT